MSSSSAVASGSAVVTTSRIASIAGRSIGPRKGCDSTLPSGPPIGHPVGQKGVVPDAIRRCRHRRPITVAVM
jgi:hypothetical protein